MVRLYTEDFCKLKPGQLLWYVSVDAEGKIDQKIPYRFDGIGDKSTWYKNGYSNKDVCCKVFSYKRNTGTTFVINRILGIRGRNCGARTVYLAKVTRKEESEFLADIITL